MYYHSPAIFKMGKSCPSKNHFQHVETKTGAKTEHHWSCNHCGFKLKGSNYKAARGRIHLSGDANLKSGLVANVCEEASTAVQEKFAADE